jgi:iron complex transport system substrate-binding protein
MNLRDSYVERMQRLRRGQQVRYVIAGALFALAMLGVANANPARVVSVGGSLTEIVYALGAEKQLVAVDTTSLYPEAALRLPKVGYARQLSSEGVLALRPTLIIATNEAGPPNALEQIRAAGVKIESTSAEHSFDELRNKVKIVATALGQVEAGRALDAKLAGDMAEVTHWIASQPSRPRVLFILSHSGAAQVSGEGTAADAMIKLAGGVNAISGFRGYKPLTAEAAIGANPDVILATTQGIGAVGGVDKLLAQPGLGLTTAGKARRVIDMEALYLLGFGPRLPQAVRDLAARIREPKGVTAAATAAAATTANATASSVAQRATP